MSAGHDHGLVLICSINAVCGHMLKYGFEDEELNLQCILVPIPKMVLTSSHDNHLIGNIILDGTCHTDKHSYILGNWVLEDKVGVLTIPNRCLP